jgi:hypothetical protein
LILSFFAGAGDTLLGVPVVLRVLVNSELALAFVFFGGIFNSSTLPPSSMQPFL